MADEYIEKVMVASGVPFTPDEEHPYPTNPEEVEFETVPSGGGSSFDPNTLPVSTNTPEDANEIITSESGTWYRKAFSKIWDYISSKLGIFIGTSAEWEAKTTEEKDAYNLEIITDDNINSQTAYDIPHGSSNVGDDLDDIRSDFDTQIGTHTVAKNVPSDAQFTDTTYTGATLKTSVTKTGSGTTVTNSIASNTSMDNAIGTLLNNDSALNSALTLKETPISGTTDGNGRLAIGELTGKVVCAYIYGYLAILRPSLDNTKYYYLHVFNADLAKLANTAVTGKLYYQ